MIGKSGMPDNKRSVQTGIGDQVETTLQHQKAAVIRMTLTTAEACAFADRLLANPKNGWRLVARS